MELLKPSYPPFPAVDRLYGFPPSQSFRDGFDPMTTPRLQDIVAEDGEDETSGVGSGGGSGGGVFVAVGKSIDKTMGLLHWTFSHFGDREIYLLHVHKPSPAIPTLLGKLPASQANADVVAAYRKEEWEQTRKLLDSYMRICSKAKAKASVVTTEAEQVPKGIVELVNKHGIRKLVMGTVSDNCMKVKKSSSKANYAAKNVSLLCEIWFINKGRHVWTREAAEGPSPLPSWRQPELANVESVRSQNPQYGNGRSFNRDSLLSSPANTTMSAGSSIHGEAVLTEGAPSPAQLSSVESHFHNQNSCSPASRGSDSGSLSMESASATKAEENGFYGQLKEAIRECKASRNEVIKELLKRKTMEMEAVKVANKVKVFESAYAHEVKLRKEAEEGLETVIQQQEKLLQEREVVYKELQRTLRNIALLDSRLEEANRRHDEASGELKLIQTSITALRHEKQKIQQQKREALQWLDRWRTENSGAERCNSFIGFVEDLPQLAEFSPTELQTATCNFSESFKIGQGGYGSVYKGEMLGRTVAIRKLYPHSMRGPSEFQQEVQLLGKLQHPHLVSLLGVSTEAWSLVYEYVPNGNLQNHLFPKGNTPPLAWKTRVRIIAQISSALCFLHSSKPEEIIHGGLKPENILLDSELRCKICDVGITRLVSEETLHCPSFRRTTEPKGAFSYTDPEFQRVGVLTPKSDVYSFGLIALQLITGRPIVGLTGEVRRALLSGQLESILDSSAGEWQADVARRLAEVGLQCCELKGRDRPGLTPALVRELEQLHIPEERPVPSYFLCPILQEIMHDPQVAADGFTYEGEAIRGWLENGRETSPMTNLRLSHLNLTHNHALRLAIQDWLCKT